MNIEEISNLTSSEAHEILLDAGFDEESVTVDDLSNEARPFPPDWKDLLRLHAVVNDRKPRVILEFGSGLSTVVIASALICIAKSNPHEFFEFHSVEESAGYLASTSQLIRRLEAPENMSIELHVSSVGMAVVGDRFATVYDFLPPISPDLIYIDGPSQSAPTAPIRGFTTLPDQLMPMAADVVFMEYFLQPGTVILVDGRSANARFLRDSFRQEWWYHHDRTGDVHFFELCEAPLGEKNLARLQLRNGGQRLSDSFRARHFSDEVKIRRSEADR